MTQESSYLGGSDVARVTYSDGSPSHWYRGDLVLEVTPSRTNGETVERGPTTYVRVGEIMDLVLPDEVARRHGLEGPEGVEPAKQAGDTTRAYSAPEAAMSTASVQHLDAQTVLPKILEKLRDEKLFFPDQEFTNHPVAEHLRGHYGQDALATKLGNSAETECPPGCSSPTNTAGSPNAWGSGSRPRSATGCTSVSVPTPASCSAASASAAT